MKFGYFDDANMEYVITTPKTPLPWINYLGCNEFFSLISNTCGGYTFYKDAKLLRLTRYRYNNVPTDMGGKYLYIKDGDTVWNPGWQPTKTTLAISCVWFAAWRRVNWSVLKQQNKRQPLAAPVKKKSLLPFTKGSLGYLFNR